MPQPGIQQIQTINPNKLPYSQYSLGDVLVYNPTDNTFYTVVDGHWVQIDDVPQELEPMLSDLSFNAGLSEEYLERGGNECNGLLDYDDEYFSGVRDLISAGNAPVQAGKLPFKETEDSDESVDDLIKKIEGII